MNPRSHASEACGENQTPLPPVISTKEHTYVLWCRQEQNLSANSTYWLEVPQEGKQAEPRGDFWPGEARTLVVPTIPERLGLRSHWVQELHVNIVLRSLFFVNQLSGVSVLDVFVMPEEVPPGPCQTSIAFDAEKHLASTPTVDNELQALEFDSQNSTSTSGSVLPSYGLTSWLSVQMRDPKSCR